MKRLLIFLPIAIALELFLWNLPRELSHHDSNLVRGIVLFGGIFIFIPTFIALSLSGLKSKTLMALAILSIPINGIGAGTRIQRQEVKELLKRGVWTTAIVTQTQSDHRKTVSYDWAVKAKYVVEGKTFNTNWEGDYTSSYQRGDTIQLIYLPDFPKIYRIKDGRNEYKSN
ncbi:MAG: DUF3592 domain-containing protein [Cyclobacteriaceae bacterium]